METKVGLWIDHGKGVGFAVVKTRT